MASSMWNRVSLQAVPVADLKISVRQQTSLKERYIGADEFTFSVYPASTPIYMELVKNGTTR